MFMLNLALLLFIYLFIFRLGETCSHVGATLFFIEKILREEREKPACTSEPCKWNKTSTNVRKKNS